MRPCGGILGGSVALGGGTAHQGNGTPHFNVEAHVVSVYQFGTMSEVVQAFRQQQFTIV